MPRREDEYWAGRKEPQGIGLCPFCGSSNVYYNNNYESWRCAKCEKSFPSPSYGPGEGFGKEARWFGKTTEEERRRESAEMAEVVKARVKERKTHGAAGSESMTRRTHNIDQSFRTNRWRSNTVVTTFAIIAVLLILPFAGVQPLADYKDSTISKVTEYLSKAKNEVGEIVAEVEEIMVTEVIPFVEDLRDEVVPFVENLRDTDIDSYAIRFNQYRQSNGFQPLIFVDDLNQRASLRLAELELDYSHNSQGKYNLHLAENIMWISFGGLSNGVAFNSWKDSPGHNANMLDASYKYTGYAIGGNYAVQLFTDLATINGVPQLPLGWYWDD
ncbi:hypothetical protein LCGC14_0411540 [marine sediment metagenome]|uniref:SCP domain-containing protein n=1 Tax=marine sediment metagenome TaxID=412755 RepID=A0A0F9TBK7_9ZZZZ